MSELTQMPDMPELEQPVQFCANPSVDNKLSEEDLSDFFSYLENQKDYLDTGLGAFHTDDHSNW